MLVALPSPIILKDVVLFQISGHAQAWDSVVDPLPTFTGYSGSNQIPPIIQQCQKKLYLNKNYG